MKKEEKHSTKCPTCERSTRKESKYCIFHASAEEKTEEEFKQALQDYVEEIKTKHIKYNFEDFIFLGDIDFKEDFNITVFKNAVFSGATFKEIAYFNESTFKGDTGFAEAIFEGDAIFRDATFKGDTSFGRVNFNGCAIFEKATFEGHAYFWYATFKGDPKFIKAVFEVFAFFNEAIFEKFAGFGKTTFESFAHFTGVTFQKGASFTKATFEDFSSFVGVFFKGGTDFMEATFKKYTIFEKATFGQITHFTKATFEDHFDFKKATFKKIVLFREATFKDDANFEGVIFERGADFSKAIFERSAMFEGINLTGGIEFIRTTVERGADFNNAIFSGCMFDRATFKGGVDFEGATFTEEACFGGVTFEGDVDLRMKSLIKGVDLREIRVLSGSKLSLRVNNNIDIISFKRASLESAYLDIELEKSILIDFTDTLLKNTKIIKSQIENHILQEKKKKFSEAQEIYLVLKNNFHSIGQYKDESWAFTKERDMQKMSKSFCSLLDKYKKYSLFKKILKKSNLLKRVIVKSKIFKKWLFSKKAIEWSNLSISDFIYQYGENPWYVIRFASIVILIFAVLLNISGIVKGERTDLILQQIKEMQGGNVLKYSGPIIGNFLNCLYFSVVTFTTLGYGDFQPLEGWSRFLVSSEALLGAFTMALFVYTFARRTGGR